MARQNNRKKNILLVKTISTITFLGVLVALILNTTQLMDIFKSNKEPKKIEVMPSFPTDTTKSVKKTSQVNKVELDKKRKEKIVLLLNEARVNKSITDYSRKKYLEAYDLLPISQKNEKFINSIKNSTISKDFGAQVNYLESYFDSLKYK
ncbi:MAG TPA: hypothetical protein VIK55_03935 [Paludibacter sp.]